MVILAHRGLRHQPEERNRSESLRLALTRGFRLETDVCDALGQLVISHDLPTEVAPFLADLLAFYRLATSTAPLAINIKSDGLRSRLQALLVEYKVENYYFCFDMSFPEMIAYQDVGLQARPVNGEFYVSPTYNLLIEQGAKIVVAATGREYAGMHGLGTPEDLQRFMQTEVFSNRKTKR